VIPRLLFAAAVIAAVVFGANCSFNPRPADCVVQQNTQFEGCFEAEITDPAGSGKLRLILDNAGQPDTRVLGGCLDLSLVSGPVFVSLAGEASCVVNQQANLTGMLPGGETLTLRVLREPATGNAVTVDITAEGSTLFTSALGAVRCGVPATCPGLGMVVPFGAGGPP
jgi:hypothetical protein